MLIYSIKQIKQKQNKNKFHIKQITKMNGSLGVRQMYNEQKGKLDYGIAGYHIEKKYIDPLKIIEERQYSKGQKLQKLKKYQTKRGNFLDDQSKSHKFCPGPGTYKTQMDWPQKSKIKRNIGDKMTYIDQIIKSNKRNKIPAPGSYNIVKILKQQEKQKKLLASKKINLNQKKTYLDQVQFQSTLVPGVGNYNPRSRAKTQYSYSKMNKKPEQWRKIHVQQQKKKPQKMPDMRTYNPQPSSFILFDSIMKQKHNKNFLGKVDRFKTDTLRKTAIPPSRYSVIQHWRGKDNSKSKIQRHGLESISKGFSRSVYYH